MLHDAHALLAHRFNHTVGFFAPGSEAWLESCLQKVATDEHAKTLLSGAVHLGSEDGFWFASDDWRSAYRPYHVRDGVLFIPVKGVLLHDFPWQFGGWATGYTYIQRAFERGVDDASVRGIAFLVDSNGGEAAGMYDLVDAIFARRDEKPLRTFAEKSYSAAYGVGSLGKRFVLSRTGGSGSVGTVTMHIDASKALDNIGWKIKFIFSGKHKVDGNPFEPLPADVEARIQARVDALRDIFAEQVARNRGMTKEAVLDTEALIYDPQQSIEIGFADEVGPFEAAIASYISECATQENEPMNGTTNAAPNQQTPAPDSSQTNQQTPAPAPAASASASPAPSPATPAAPAAAAPSSAEVAKTERERISAILESPEGKANPSGAQHFAFHTSMSAEESVAALKAVGPAAAPTPESGKNSSERTLDRLMSEGNPDVGASGGSPEGNSQQSVIDRISANYDAVRGIASK